MVARLLVLFIGAASPVFAAEQAPDLFFEAVLDPPRAYVQSQVRYRVRLYRSSVFQQGDFITPEIPGAVIRLAAEDEPVEVLRRGRAYQMIERRYLLFPQKSGTLRLPGAIYSGREAYARGESLELEVLPAAWAAGAWLPATGLTLREVWRLPEPPRHVGAHLERSITLEARGLTGAQIPSLALGSVPGLRHQRTQVRVDDRLQGFGILGRRTERHLYVPTDTGSLRVPGYRLPWWDLEAATVRVAKTPGRSFFIQAPVEEARSDEGLLMPAKGDPAVGTGTVGTIADRLGRWFPALAGALLGGVLLWRFALRAIPERLRRRSALRRCLARLEAACLGSDPSAAGHALLEWGGASWGAARPLTLGGLAARLDDPEAAVILRRLDAALYSGRAGAWDSGQCLQGMRRILMARRAFRYPRPPSPLPPLNP